MFTYMNSILIFTDGSHRVNPARTAAAPYSARIAARPRVR